jgi:hypothetical protein
MSRETLKAALDEALFAMLGSQEFVNSWWTSPNLAFDLKQPKEVFQTKPAQVQKYIINQLQR